MSRDIIRRCLFRPYRKGHGPVFTLVVWDLPTNYLGKERSYLGYRLMMREDGGKPVVLFEGEDFGCSPLHAIDSDAAVVGIMGFLTLRRGDTDWDHFKDYTPTQFEFTEQYAEALGYEVQTRYCDEDGRVKK